MSENITPFVKGKIDEIQQKTGVNRSEIIEDYIQQLNSPMLQKDTQLNEDSKRRYSIMVIWRSYTMRQPVKMTTIIVVGIGGIRITRAGKKQGEAMVLFRATTGIKLRRLVFHETGIDYMKELSMFSKYEVKIGEFSAGGDMVADNRADFSNPINTGLTADRVFKTIGAQRVPKLSVANMYPSRVNDAGYTDPTDWRIVRGLVHSKYRGPRKKNPDQEMGVYNLIDFSINTEDVTMPDGSTKRPGFTCWTPPELVIWKEDSELELAGPISLGKDGSATMNTFLINPLFAIPIEED